MARPTSASSNHLKQGRDYLNEVKMVRPAGLEPAASRLEVSRSIQMSYGRIMKKPAFLRLAANRLGKACQPETE